MEKEFIPYEQALALKELGFDEHCFGFYGDDSKILYQCYVNKGKVKYCTLAPTFSQAFRWFREKYNLHSNIISTGSLLGYEIWKFSEELDECENFNNYGEAEIECLKKLIEIVKAQK